MVNSSGGKAARPGYFVEVLRDSQRFREVDQSRIDKLYKVECICRLAA